MVKKAMWVHQTSKLFIRCPGQLTIQSDSRIPALIRNGVQEKKRSFFVVVGDRQKDVIVHLYHILLNVDLKLNKSVLWAYKNKLLGFSSHRKKREKKIKKEIKRGIREADTDDPFELFVSTQSIRYVYYKETEKILGNTFGMCILQDFEAITPNLLARTIETVQGGGLVLLLLKGMNSLKQMYTLSMDVHSRYRTEAHGDVTARFNERFILSLGGCDSCLVVDDELNVLPISGGKSVVPSPVTGDDSQVNSATATQLEKIKESLADSQPIGSLVTLARTIDQAKALMTFMDAIVEKTLQSTVTLTAARGRGKSAALGLSVAAAVAHGYSNIFITSPSPENLKTLFEFVFKGFDALSYMDHVDYSIIQSTNPDFNKAIVRVNVHRQHRQTIQYIRPEDAYTLGQAELLVIDEAAAIPLPLVRKLLGPYLVFMASTINGYEGTGRSLSLKLIQQLREQASGKPMQTAQGRPFSGSTEDKNAKQNAPSAVMGRKLREITLSEPIRYAAGDGVEKWLNKLLCLDATLPQSQFSAGGYPHPSKCQLLRVNRDTLFSFHPVSERFLEQMMAIYVSSHYKNTPNDLQLMSDAPAHQLYVLVPPLAEEATALPEPLCVLQVVLEGQISKQSVSISLGRGQRASGDLIPWTVSQQYQDEDFAGLSGARVVRIATSSSCTGMGYGAQALKSLIDFYEGNLATLSEDGGVEEQQMVRVTDEELANASLLQDNIHIRDITSMPPLFSHLSELRPPSLDYIGVSYGVTPMLHRFWKRASFVPVYLRQTANDLTGEHTCIMLRALERGEAQSGWLNAYAQDFHKRFLSLLSYNFRTFPSIISLSINEAVTSLIGDGSSKQLSKADLDTMFSAFDLKRLESYAKNMLDHHVILDMLPTIATLYFTGRMKPAVQLSGVQTSLLLAIGLQRKQFEDVEQELGLASAQLLSMFVKIMRKVSTHFHGLLEKDIDDRQVAENGTNGRTEDVEMEDAEDALPRKFQPLDQSLEEELMEAGNEVKEAHKREKRALIDSLPLEQYEMNAGVGGNWDQAEKQIRLAQEGDSNKSMTVSVKSVVDPATSKRKVGSAVQDAQREAEEVRSSKKSKKKSKGRS